MGTQDVPAAVAHDVVGLLDTNAADNSNLVFVLADTAAHVVHLVERGHRVFVHCVAAENRTPAMAAAYPHTRGATPDSARTTTWPTGTTESTARQPQAALERAHLTGLMSAGRALSGIAGLTHHDPVGPARP